MTIITLVNIININRIYSSPILDGRSYNYLSVVVRNKNKPSVIRINSCVASNVIRRSDVLVAQSASTLYTLCETCPLVNKNTDNKESAG